METAGWLRCRCCRLQVSSSGAWESLSLRTHLTLLLPPWTDRRNRLSPGGREAARSRLASLLLLLRPPDTCGRSRKARLRSAAPGRLSQPAGSLPGQEGRTCPQALGAALAPSRRSPRLERLRAHAQPGAPGPPLSGEALAVLPPEPCVLAAQRPQRPALKDPGVGPGGLSSEPHAPRPPRCPLSPRHGDLGCRQLPGHGVREVPGLSPETRQGPRSAGEGDPTRDSGRGEEARARTRTHAQALAPRLPSAHLDAARARSTRSLVTRSPGLGPLSLD